MKKMKHKIDNTLVFFDENEETGLDGKTTAYQLIECRVSPEDFFEVSPKYRGEGSCEMCGVSLTEDEVEACTDCRPSEPEPNPCSDCPGELCFICKAEVE